MKLFPTLRVLTETASAPIQAEQGCDAEWKKAVIRKVAWIVIFAYAIMMVKPVIPVFADTLAHTFWEKQHMIVHEEHGRFHVHYEVMKAYGQTDKGKSSGQLRSVTEDDLYVFSNNNHHPVSNNHKAVMSNYTVYTCRCIMSYPDMNYPPPKYTATI